MLFKYNIFGYDKEGYNRKGFNKEGYNRDGYDQNGYDKNGFDRNGFNQNGYDKDGYDKDGYDQKGYDKEGYKRNGFNQYGYDKNGFDRNGFNQNGYDKDGYDKDGYDPKGYDKEGYKRNGFNQYGYDKNGFNQNGYDKDGYNRKGFNKEGYNRDGYDKDGYNRDGYDKDGYNRNGYDKNGYDRKGYDKYGQYKGLFDEDDEDDSDFYRQTPSNIFEDEYIDDEEEYDEDNVDDEEEYEEDVDEDDASDKFRALLKEFLGFGEDEPNSYKKHKSDDVSEISAIKIGLASPDQIRAWSYGEVKKPESINYRTLKPEKDGLYCERIFGPQRDLECRCGKYRGTRYIGKICECCGVEITGEEVRSERMGHIELAVPVSHIWYFKGIPSRMGLLLDITSRDLEKVLYFAKYIVIDPGDTKLEQNQILSEKEYMDMSIKYDDKFRVGMGAEAIKELLQKIDIDKLCKELRQEIKYASSFRQSRLVKRLAVAEAFKQSGNKPEWMILDVIPVIPPDIRPMVQLDGGRFATSDLNDFYRRVINRNNRVKRLMELKAPDVIIRNEKRMLQEAVDALIDNGRRGRPVTGPNNRALKSLSDMLKGNQGCFRQNLLGKCVDYSGRSVVVVGPELKLYQCGLPKEMALELFKPFVMKKLVDDGWVGNMKSAKMVVERAKLDKGCIYVFDALAEVMKNKLVLLSNTAPLSKHSVQAFEPVLVEGKAIRVSPLVYATLNVRSEDLMAVHVPLSREAQAEARLLMLASKNLLKPSDGKPAVIPTQDMLLGVYYLTMVKDGEQGEGKVFRDINEATMAYDEGDITLHAKIKIRMTKEVNGVIVTMLVPTTLGRVIFNNLIPQDLGFVDRYYLENAFALEVDFLVKKGGLGKIIDRCIKVHGVTVAAEMLDKIKTEALKYATRSGVTIAVCDAKIPETKKDLLANAEERVDVINDYYNMGLCSAEVRSRAVAKIWEETTYTVSSDILENLGETNPIYMMVDSGACDSKAQLSQIAGVYGIAANTKVPIRANYREGLNTFEYFLSSRGARKGLADKALRIADAGYLTRRLVDASQDVIIREEDCGCKDGAEVYDITEGKEMFEPLYERLTGRYLLEHFFDEEGNLVASKNEMLTEEKAKVVADMVKARMKPEDRKIKIRSLLTCDSEYGVCAKCYGANLATGTYAHVGEVVGVIAAQSMGEEGTRLTRRIFFGDNSLQGLPRVEELFEARIPRGDSLNPHDILATDGVKAVQDYLIKELQKTYRMQGIDINDKHFEIIVRQMMRNVKVIDAGTTELIPDAIIDKKKLAKANEKACLRAKETGEAFVPAECAPVLLGITKTALATDSFLAAASFQETTRVLTDAAIKGKVDPLVGVKENVIIGKPIPTGTGVK